MQRIPEKTVERLSQYRRTLVNLISQGKTHIYSHQLAQLHSVTAVQVRRDLMFIGYSGAQRKGYEVKELVRYIGSVLDPKDGLNHCIVGMGNLGRAITSYFSGHRQALNLIASFDNDPAKVDRMIAGIYCHPMKNLKEVIESKNISIAIMTVPMDHATEVAKELVMAGIKGILNLTTVPLVLPPHIFVEDYDMITSLEKVAYFVNLQPKQPGI